MVIVSWRTITREILSHHPSTIQIRQIVVPHLISISQENIDSIVVLQKLSDSVGKGIGFLLPLVHPVTYIQYNLL